jgi:hypothetical protein
LRWDASRSRGEGVDSRNNGISATPQFGKFDREAVLSNLRYQGKYYAVTAKGISPSP